MTLGGDNSRVVLWDILAGVPVSEGVLDNDRIPRIGLPAGMNVALLTSRGNALRTYCTESTSPETPLGSFDIPR